LLALLMDRLGVVRVVARADRLDGALVAVELDLARGLRADVGLLPAAQAASSASATLAAPSRASRLVNRP
jgi:hypothetical protein